MNRFLTFILLFVFQNSQAFANCETSFINSKPVGILERAEALIFPKYFEMKIRNRKLQLEYEKAIADKIDETSDDQFRTFLEEYSHEIASALRMEDLAYKELNESNLIFGRNTKTGTSYAMIWNWSMVDVVVFFKLPSGVKKFDQFGRMPDQTLIELEDQSFIAITQIDDEDYGAELIIQRITLSDVNPLDLSYRHNDQSPKVERREIVASLMNKWLLNPETAAIAESIGPALAHSLLKYDVSPSDIDGNRFNRAINMGTGDRVYIVTGYHSFNYIFRENSKATDYVWAHIMPNGTTFELDDGRFIRVYRSNEDGSKILPVLKEEIDPIKYPHSFEFNGLNSTSSYKPRNFGL